MRKNKKYEINDINYTIICNSNLEAYKKTEGKNSAEHCKSLNEKVLMQINNLNYILTRGKVLDLIEITGNPTKFLVRSFISGISKGIGVGIGFTIATAIIIYLLQKIIRLNIPVISKYISDIIDIVERTK